MNGLELPKALRLDARNTESWEAWINDYELYAIASGLTKKPANVQYAVFLVGAFDLYRLSFHQ